MMMRLLILGALAAVPGGSAKAEPLAVIDHPAECRVAQHQIADDFLLPRVIRAIATKRLRVLVVGAGSSVLPGPDGVKNAYPARLQSALAAALPGVSVTVTANVESRRTALEMVKSMPAALDAAQPALVIWQTGTVDAMRGVDQDQFNQVLEQGINTIRSAGADVIFVNSQYSPRTESMIALGAYVESMRWVAVQHEIPLFDRFSIMKLWADLGTFNLFSAANKRDVAKRIHDCLGRLLADLVLESIKPKEPLADSVFR